MTMTLKNLRRIKKLPGHSEAIIKVMQNGTRETFNNVNLDYMQEFQRDYSMVSFPCSQVHHKGQTTLEEFVNNLENHLHGSWYSTEKHSKKIILQSFREDTEIAIVDPEYPFKGHIVAWFYHQADKEIIFFID